MLDHHLHLSHGNHTMADFIDGQSLCLAQGSVLCESILLKEEAHVTGTFKKVLVCLLCLQVMELLCRRV